METNAMEVKNLSFSYGSNQILSDISLTIPRGKITTIMGANGCGKSTLFSLMTKNLTPGKGKILLEEKSIKKYSLSEFARKVSIVHQHNSAAEDITIERLVSYGRTPYQKMLGGKSEENGKAAQMGQTCMIVNDHVTFVQVDYLTNSETEIVETSPAKILEHIRKRREREYEKAHQK